MSGVQEILEWIREHPSFDEFMTLVEAPGTKAFRPSQQADSAAQTAEWIFRSGRQLQHELWRNFLITYQEKESDGRSKASRG